MATKLKDLSITSTDLVEQGANPDAKIRLFKKKNASDDDAPSENLLQKAIAALQGVFGRTCSEYERSSYAAHANQSLVQKEAGTFSDEMEERKLREVCSEVWDFTYAIDDSLCSIVFDMDLSEDQKRVMMMTSLDEFAETLRTAIPNWAAGKRSDDKNVVEKSAVQKAAFDALVTAGTVDNDTIYHTPEIDSPAPAFVPTSGVRFLPDFENQGSTFNGGAMEVADGEVTWTVPESGYYRFGVYNDVDNPQKFFATP